jgi:hypothetical protein
MHRVQTVAQLPSSLLPCVPLLLCFRGLTRLLLAMSALLEGAHELACYL